MKWELGDRILQDELHFERAGYGQKIVERIAKDLGVSRTDLFRCVQFRRKYPTLSQVWDNLGEGKNISWAKVIRQLSNGEEPSDPDNCQHSWILHRTCKFCGHKERHNAVER